MRSIVRIVHSRFKVRLLTAGIVFLLMLSSFAVFFVDTVKAQPPYINDIIIMPSSTNVTVGDGFSLLIFTNVSWEMTNVTISNITFLPAGKLNYLSTSQGNLSPGGQFFKPENPGWYPGGGIYNSSGYALPIVWSNTSVNLTFGQVANVTWFANSVGLVYINLTGATYNEGGANHSTNTQNATVLIHPQCPSSFTSTTLSSTQMRLDFTSGIGADKTIIRRVQGMTPPMNITDGTEVYNGSGTSFVDSNLVPGLPYSYSAWGLNSTENLYSLWPSGAGGGTYPGGPGWFLQEHYSDVAPRYIENGTQQKFNFSFISETGGPTQSLHNLTIILPQNLTYVGNNGTTVQNPGTDFTVYNTSKKIVWNATDYANGFLCDGTKNFWFNASASGSLGSLKFQVVAYNNYSEYQSFYMTAFITKNFSFTGSIKDINGNVIEGATANITVYSFSQDGPPVTVGYFSADTNATGQFNVTGIPTTEDNISGLKSGEKMGPGGGGDLFYTLSAVEYEPTKTYAINISTSLPSLPIGEFVSMLDNPEIYLKPAISFRVNTTGPNYNWSSKKIDDYSAKIFQINVKDLKLGYSVKELFTSSYDKIFSVPAGRNYSFSIFPDRSFPVSIRFYNITSTCEGSGDFNINGVNTTCMPYNGTYLVNVSVNVSYNHRWISGSFNGISDIAEMSVVAYIMEDQDRIFENWALPFNLANESGGSDNSYDTAARTYNISLPATMAPSYIMLRAYAKTSPGAYYMGSHILSSSGGNLSESTYDFTMSLLINGSTRLVTSNNVSNNWTETVIANTTAVQFNLVNSTGSLLSNENAFIDIKRELDGFDYMYMTDAQNGQFNVSLTQGSSLKKLTIYSQQYAPVSTYVSSSVLSGDENTTTISCSNGECNITMRQFGDYDPFEENSSFSMGMYTSNSSCDVPDPPAYCELCSDQNESEFSPFNAILKGDVSLMISSGNTSVYYLNVDLLASGPPDACFDNGTEIGGGLEAAWQFGSQGPDIYDTVLIKIPYPDNLINKTVKVTIPVLYDNEFNPIWNSSVNNTADILNDPRLGDYKDYLSPPYAAYLNGTGVICNASDPTLSSGIGYKDTVEQVIWIKIPHFSGVGPVVGGDPPDPPTGFTATKAGTGQIDLSWALGNKSDYTRIQRKESSHPTSVSDGTNVYNSTGTSKSDTTDLSAGITYYYSAWSWNVTEKLWSTSYVTSHATTDSQSGNPPSVPGGETNQTTNEPPKISNVSHLPTTVTSEDTVTVYATVTDDYIVGSVLLYWNDGSEHSKSMSLSSGIYSATIGPFTELATITYWINATDNESQSIESSTYSFTVSDVSGPAVTIISPSSGSIIYDTTPMIKGSYSDPSGINTTSVSLSVDGSKVTPQTKTSSVIAYTPSTAMDYGNHTVKIEVSDTLGNNRLKEWSFTIEETESITEEELGNITSGETTEVTPENTEETGVESINFLANTNLTNVKIVVAKLKEKPNDITDEPTNKKVYTYLNLEITANDTYLDEDSIGNLTIKFKVKLLWIENNSIDKETITLLRFKDGQWEELDTTKTNEDSTYVYFEATTSGLSTFAVAGEEIEEEPETVTPGIDYLLIVGAVVAIIILVILILFKTGFLYIEKETKKSKKNETFEKDKK